MSEYQYYEFQTVDRHLSAEEIAELQTYSTRANITKTSFTNEYHWGDFKGPVDKILHQYFDGFLYYANWGTHILKFRLPADNFVLKTLQSYCTDYALEMKQIDDNFLLSFSSETELYECDWEEEWSLSSFLQLRTQLIRGDLRSLYLGWLLGVQSDEYAEDELEPPVPPGLGELNEELISLAEFFDIDMSLIEAAAQQSPPLTNVILNEDNAKEWISNLTSQEKDEVLTNLLLEGSQGNFTSANRIIQAFYHDQIKTRTRIPQQSPRTVAQLLEIADGITEIRKKEEAERKALEKARKEKELYLQRQRVLDNLIGKEPAMWQEVESLIEKKQSASYKKAISLLIDLRDLATRGDNKEYLSRITDLHERNKRKPSFIKLLSNATLI